MSYNGSGTFQINTSGQPVVAGTVISSTAFNALTADLATGLSTAITKDGQTTATARIPFAQGITSTLVTDSSSTSTGSIITAGGVGIAKNLYVGVNANIAGTLSVTGSTTLTNPVINNIKMGYTTTATAAGTTTLSVSSNYRQFFTGTLAQTIVLPVTSTLVTGMAFEIENNSTGLLTVNSSGGNLVGTIPAGVCAHAVCIGITLTTAADWDWDYISTSTITGTGANVLGTSPTITTPTISSLSSAAATALTLQSAGTTAITVDTSQNVGIGTASPSTYGKLAVVGDGYFSGALGIGATSLRNLETIKSDANTTYGTAAAQFPLNIRNTDTTANNWAMIGFNQGASNLSNPVSIGAQFASTTTASMVMVTSGSERMRIDSSGSVFMNTTTNWSGNAILNVTGANWVVSGYSTGTASNTGAFLSRVDNVSCRLMMFYYGAVTNVGYITTNGTTTSYGSASDYRLKENISPMTGALAKVALLKPVTYTWKSDGSDGQGFIAHELQEVVPHCVAGEKDAVDSDGKPQYQGVDTSFLVATLTAALQELKALVDTQASTITALTARITALENK